MSIVTNLKMLKFLAKKPSPRLLLSVTSARPRQDLDTKDISEMVAVKSIEEKQENSFTNKRTESNGMMAADFSGAKCKRKFRITKF